VKPSADQPAFLNRRQFLGHSVRSIGAAAVAVSSDREALAAILESSVPDFGIMLNDDGGQSFTDIDPKRSEAALRTKVRSLADTAVRTLIYQVVAGSEIALYPTKVGSAWGWRKAPGESAPPWDKQMPFLRAAAANSLDAGRMAGEEARAMGLRFMPGYRMNDAHFSSKPFDHPATGRFWIENHERFKIGQAPSERMQFVANLLDYSHAEVRAHRLAILSEIIGRYADIMDGVQLDFMRQPYLFPPGTGEARQDLMNEFIAQVRAKLDEAGKQQGRFLCLSVRVPPTLPGCRWAGLDVKAWLQRRLVNVLVLSPSMTLAHDMPVDEFVALAEPTGAKVYPAVFRQTPFIWPFTTEPSVDSYRRSPSRVVTAAQVRGAALNYLPMGAAGFELFNFNLPPASFTLDAIAALANPRNGQRIYAITQAYASDREDTEYRKQIPVVLSPAAPAELTLIVGENLAERDLRDKTHATLRLGLHGLGKRQPDILIDVNGRPIYNGPVAKIATPVSGRESQPSKLNPPRVETYLQMRLTDGAIFRTGRNQLSLHLQTPDARASVRVVEVQLAVANGR
jgi:hypothetical protein